MYFLELGTTGFGGPIALVARMHRDLVEDRQWITAGQYGDGLALAQLAPGPLAAQLAMYIGWVRGGAIGSALIGVAFVLPSLLMVFVISALYVRYGGMAWMSGAFYGVGAAVIGIIARGAWGLARKSLAGDAALWIIFGINALATALLSKELFTVVVASGVAYAMLRGKPHGASGTRAVSIAFGMTAVGTVAIGTNSQLFLFFVKASLVVFGSGLAVVPFMYGGVVQGHAWLTEQQFIDAVAVSMITPGPVVITVAFIGYLVNGAAGALFSAAGMFLPVYLTVVLAAPHYAALRQREPIRLFISGVTAAATGAIAGAAVVLGRRAIIDGATLAIAAIAIIVLHPRLRAPEPLVILAAGIAGVLLRSP